ncbi:MAG: GMC family oxidoreductase, partial [Bacteroidota bacterium]
VLDRGKPARHPEYPTAEKAPWELPNYNELDLAQLKQNPSIGRYADVKPSNFDWFMKDEEQPYVEQRPFLWIRGDQVGGRSITWGRHVYRWSDLDFEANLRDGIAIDWPIRYTDIAPWYDYVESYIGVSGEKLGLSQLPDGIFQPPMEMNCVEKHLADNIQKVREEVKVTIGRVANLTQPLNGRSACKFRNRCDRGCPYAAYFCSLSSTLPAAERAGNMTLKANKIVTEVLFDESTQKATGVRVLDKQTRQYEEYFSKIIFLNAGSFNSTWILMNSKSNRFPNGMGNDSGELGHNVMDHYIAGGASGDTDLFQDQYYKGRRPNGIYIPRFQNIPGDKKKRNYIRGFQMQGDGGRIGWNRNISEAVYGLDFKNTLLQPGKWNIKILGLGETLPYHDNRIYLHQDKVDKYGLPQLVMDVHWRENEQKMAEDMIAEAVDILEKGGIQNVRPERVETLPSLAVHEMGTARMGHDPKTSVLNKWNQIHAVKNVFVTDGACMTSAACQNPSLTYMALTVRAADFAVEALKKGDL